MKNIFIVGFMGTGKTVVSRELAKTIQFEYASTDQLIVEHETQVITQIFNEKGEAYFRKIEKRVLEDCVKKDMQVVDTGGGIMIDDENVGHMKNSGPIICLRATEEAIWNRVRKLKTRPLLNTKNPRESIKALLQEREETYKKADFFVDTTEMAMPEIISTIIAHLESY